MQQQLFKNMLDDGLITPQQFEDISHFEKTKPVSLHWDLRVLLYAGIFLFVTGLGIFIYENIDSIGHITVIILTGAGCVACFAWCFKYTPPFSFQKVQSPSVLFDYVLLLGSLLLLTFTGYIQFRYHVFGDSWGLATFVPMILLFLSAYYFDHLGVLSLAITNLAAWAGITVTPLQLLLANNFSSSHLIYTGITLGAGLILIALTTGNTNFKAHFDFTYKNFGTHLLLVSCVAGMVYFDSIYIWFLAVLLPAAVLFLAAVKDRSFYFIVVTTLYAYIALSGIVVHAFREFTRVEMYIVFIYFIASGIGLIKMFMYYNKILQINDGL